MTEINKKDNILKIDLDLKTKKKAIEFLTDRLTYLYKLNWIDIHIIDEIFLIKKKTFGCKIVLKKNVRMNYIFFTQLLLGSDYKKECCSLINFYKLEMEYSNRLFTSKRYIGGKFKHAKVIDVTSLIITEVVNRFLENLRKKNEN